MTNALKSNVLAKLGETWRETLALWIEQETEERVLLRPNPHYPPNQPAASAAPPPPPPMPEYGAGTLAMKGIDLTSHGLAKPAANAVARFFGKKKCNCEARARCMNRVVPDVREMTALGWVKHSPALLWCLGAKEENSPDSATNKE